MHRRMCGVTCGTRRELKRIEAGLTVQDIALFRWRAWAVFTGEVDSLSALLIGLFPAEQLRLVWLVLV